MTSLALIGLLALSATDAPQQTWTGEPVVDAPNFESIPSEWHQSLQSTTLVGYKPGEYLILSGLYTGREGVDASMKFMLMVKVTTWGKAVSTTLETDHAVKETFTVTLHEMSDPKQMRADYDHVVMKEGKVFIRFSGTNILSRPN